MRLYLLGLLFVFFIPKGLIGQVEQQANKYKETLLEIGEDDQRYREANTDWSKQNPLDKNNRDRLDRLYSENGFPSEALVGKEAILALILVVHHSTDCEWNRKWVLILLENYKEVQHFKVLLNAMSQRQFIDHCAFDKTYQNHLRENFDWAILQEFGLARLMDK